MYRDSNKRTILKTITWRITATLTTTILVFVFTGRLDWAIEVGILEVIAKMIFYFFHERIWERLKFGKLQIPSFVVWITGIPRSGKTTLAKMIHEELNKEDLKLQTLDSHDVRPLFPETGFTRDEVNNHIKRVGHLASMLEKNGIITIASFVSPYRESRNFVENTCNNYIEVFLDTTPEYVKNYDKNEFYQKAEQGMYTHVPGMDVEYEQSEHPTLKIDMTRNSLEDARDQVIDYIREHYVRKSIPRRDEEKEKLKQELLQTP